MNQITVTVSDDLKHWVDTRIAFGKYVDAEDYIRDLLRREQMRDEGENEWLREQIEIGLASGISDEAPETIIENIIARRRAANG